MAIRRCARCSVDKDEAEFYRGQSYCKPCSKQANREWHAKNKHRRTARRYGISVERARALQESPCHVCGGATETAHIDHCHKTGLVRGALCGRCNRALGLLDDDPERIRALAGYIERSSLS